MNKKFISLLFLLAFILPAKSSEILDTSTPLNLFTFGGRIGFNTSNRTFPGGHFNMWNNNGWGTGFDLGVVANLNFKEYLSLQPGIFFDSRSGSYSYLTGYINNLGLEDTHYEMGHLRGYNITIPIMGIIKLNVAPQFKVSGEFGPYFQFSLKQTGQNNVNVLYRQPQSNEYGVYIAQLRKYDVGLKMGFGISLFDNYYIGVHYLAGMCNAWKHPAGGKNKEWLFTVGYDF